MAGVLMLATAIALHVGGAKPGWYKGVIMFFGDVIGIVTLMLSQAVVADEAATRNRDRLLNPETIPSGWELLWEGVWDMTLRPALGLIVNGWIEYAVAGVLGLAAGGLIRLLRPPASTSGRNGGGGAHHRLTT